MKSFGIIGFLIAGLAGGGGRRKLHLGVSVWAPLVSLYLWACRTGARMADRPNDKTAEEQAALRRVSTLVARGADSEVVFATVAQEAAVLFGADAAVVVRHEPGGETTVMAGHGLVYFEPGMPFSRNPSPAVALAWRTGSAVRYDADDPASPGLPEQMRAERIRSTVNAAILVEDQIWGIIGIGSRDGSLPPAAGDQLVSFTELVATAIAEAQARSELRGFAEEQAALRRVAMLAATAAGPDEVFAAVTAEAGRILRADVTVLSQYTPDGAELVVGAWADSGDPPVAVGRRAPLGGRNVTSLVFHTDRPARIDGYADASGSIGSHAHAVGVRASVGVPVSVAGELWGVMIVATRAGTLPANTEERLTGFTELAATAIANAHARGELRQFAREQAALRRVATLVARNAPPAEVFAAVTAEAGLLMDADRTSIGRYEPDGTQTVVGSWTSAGTDEPVRPGADTELGIPVTVEGRPWGVVTVVSKAPMPAGSEAPLARFTELAATAIANAGARAELTASRGRIVTAVDAARRRIERDLRDAAQQRLVSLAAQLRVMQVAAPAEAADLVEQLEAAITDADGLLDELAEISRGLHPSVLADGGLGTALTTLARRSAIPVQLDVRVEGRLPEPTELTAYYTVSEALTNAAKHSGASAAEVEVTAGEDTLRVSVRDDGSGGADFSRGSGLTGLRDRVEAIGGRIALTSPEGAGTTVEIALPLQLPAPRRSDG